MTDCREAIVVRFDDERLRFEPRDDGRWRRFEQTWTGCRWRTRGTELVDAVAVTVGDE
jgi:hypothetical protein